MCLTTKQITKKTTDYKYIKELYHTAFPKYEQSPISLLNKWAKKDNMNFTAYYDNELFCGITFTIELNNNIYILYIAVTENLRSKGYGTKILNYIKNYYNNNTIYLAIEPLDKNADNYEQRLKRYAFYEKNGFYNTKKLVTTGSNFYLILASKNEFSNNNFIALIKTFNKKSHPIIVDLPQ